MDRSYLTKSWVPGPTSPITLTPGQPFLSDIITAGVWHFFLNRQILPHPVPVHWHRANQSHYTDTGPTIPSTDPVTAGVWHFSADRSYLTQSQYTDTGPTISITDPMAPGVWLGSRRSNFFLKLTVWWDWGEGVGWGWGRSLIGLMVQPIK